jgi:hypothetical protein
VPVPPGDVAADHAGLHQGVLTRAEVEDVVRTCFQELASRARITAFLPVLTRHRAEDRLVELAQQRHESAHPVPKVVFVCRRSEGRAFADIRRRSHPGPDRQVCPGQGTTTDGGERPRIPCNCNLHELVRQRRRAAGISSEAP